MTTIQENTVFTLQEKMEGQLQLLIETKTKISIHLDLLNTDLRRSLNSSYHTLQTRINHLEKAELNLLEHICFLEDVIKKIGGCYNASTR